MKNEYCNKNTLAEHNSKMEIRDIFSFYPEVSKGKTHCLAQWFSVRNHFSTPSREHLAKSGDIFAS